MDSPIEKRECILARRFGWLVLVLAIAACSGDDNAIPCGPAYNLGCVGDGRPDSTTTPNSLPKRSCAKDDYTYFGVHMNVSSPRDSIAQCELMIVDEYGKQVAGYVLPSGTNPENGKAYGCSLGQTPGGIGDLSYSSCCTYPDALSFRLLALSPTGETVQEANENGTCYPYPPEVVVDLFAQPID
jgi:hypothetical protein